MKRQKIISLKKLISLVLLISLELTTVPTAVLAQEISATPTQTQNQITPTSSSSSPTTTPPTVTANTTPTAVPPSPTQTSTVTPTKETVQSTPAPSPTFIPTPTLFDIPGVSPTLTPYVIPILVSPRPIDSAKIKQPAKILPLPKRHYMASESITARVVNLKYPIKTALLYAGEKEISLPIYKEIVGEETIFRISPEAILKPGKYTLKVTDDNGQVSTQDFTWGVLAVNTNKSIYLPGETAKLSLAVLDELGKMVCDASLSLEITDPNGVTTTLSTEGGKIIVNTECSSHAFTLKPDFQTDYMTNGVGKYLMLITANAKNGTYTISDLFEVRNRVPFDVERTTATRIYPANTYPVNFDITASEDFDGLVEETVPDTFIIEPSSAGLKYDSIRIVPAQNLVDASSKVPVNIRFPFEGNSTQTLGFGQNLTDPLLKDIYAQYGLAGHDGIDFDMPEGTPVLAADDGEIVLAGDAAYGTTIVIKHSWGQSYYGHLSQIDVSLNQKVKKGDAIGLSGQTGLTTAPHLHFGIKLNKNNPQNGFFGKTDPLPYLTSPTIVTASSVQIISWKISIKKGETVILGYQFKAPMTSPELYKLGPLTFRSSRAYAIDQKVENENPFILGKATESATLKEASVSAATSETASPSATNIQLTTPKETGINSIVFQEIRQWQIAADVVTTKFMDDGTDSTQAFQFWSGTGTAGISIFSDTAVKNTGPRSIKANSTASNYNGYVYQTTALADAGRRISAYFNFTNLPTGTTTIILIDEPGSAESIVLRITSGGVLQLWKSSGQIGSNGSTLSTGTWYRITLAYTITSTTVNQFRVFLDGSSTADITASNTTLASTGLTNLFIGWIDTPGASKVMNFDDIYIDDSTALTNPGDIRVTYKGANSETNTAFDTKIGANRSTTDYNSINERSLSETNGWRDSTSNTPGALENYGIQNASTGDVDISTYTVVAREAWVWAKKATSGTVTTAASLFNNGTETSITLGNSSALFTNIVDSSTYPTDTQAVGMRAISGTADTFFYEAGMMIAFLVPAAGGPTNDQLMRHGNWFSSGAEQSFTF